MTSPIFRMNVCVLDQARAEERKKERKKEEKKERNVTVPLTSSSPSSIWLTGHSRAGFGSPTFP